jgi:hypothetical protein|tara:strand:+ start:43 stop:264 length:222 start_codon:yes stop_codon:yes gene_type:complete
MNDMKFTTAGDYMKDVDMIQEPTDEVMVEKAAAERLRKSELARTKRKAVKEKKELDRGVFDKSKLTYTDGDNT